MFPNLQYGVLTLTLQTYSDAQRRRLRRVGKTRYSTPDVAAHRLGQDEAYFTLREILAESSTAADGVL